MSRPQERFGVALNVNRLLLLIGLLCDQMGQPKAGEQILRAMKAYRDDLPHPRSYLAVCLISQGRLREAEDELNACRKTFAGHQLAKVLLGIVWREAGRDDWQKPVQEVVDDGRDEHAVKFALETLGVDANERRGPPDANVHNTLQTTRVYA